MDTLLKNFGVERVEKLSKNNSEPDWLRNFRLSSFEFFKNLPVETSELFKKYVNLDGINWEQFDFSKSDGTKIPEDFKFLFPENNNHVAICNSNVLEIPSSVEKDGIVFLDIKTAIQKYPDICKNYFANKILKPEESKLVAFNNTFFNSGFFLYVPDNKNITVPLRVVSITTPENSLGVNQNLIVVGKNSKLILIEEEYSKTSGKQTLLSNVTDIHLKDGAEVTLGNIHSLDENTILLVNKKVLLEKDSKIFFSSGFFGGKLTLSYLDSVLKGDGSAVEDYEIVFGGNEQQFNLSSNLFHEGASTRGKVMAKGVFGDKSKGLFRGMININKNAKNSNSYVSGHSIILSKNASSDAIPGLQIENNDVKATHSASVAQINEEQVFYLMSRGFTEDQARKFVVSGFLEPVIKQIPLREVVAIIKGLFEIKWNRRDLSELKETVGKISEEEITETSSKDIFEGHYKYR